MVTIGGKQIRSHSRMQGRLAPYGAIPACIPAGRVNIYWFKEKTMKKYFFILVLFITCLFPIFSQHRAATVYERRLEYISSNNENITSHYVGTASQWTINGVEYFELKTTRGDWEQYYFTPVGNYYNVQLQGSNSNNTFFGTGTRTKLVDSTQWTANFSVSGLSYQLVFSLSDRVIRTYW